MTSIKKLVLGSLIVPATIMVSDTGRAGAPPVGGAPVALTSGPPKDHAAAWTSAGAVLAMGTSALYSFGTCQDPIVQSLTSKCRSFDGTGQPVTAGSTLAIPKTGGASVTLATFKGPTKYAGEGPLAITADADFVYWIKGGSFAQSSADGALLKVPVRGGPVVTMLTGPISGTSTSMTVDGANVYWTDGNRVLKAALAGGDPTVLASNQPGAAGIVVDATNVYWANSLSDMILSIPIAGGTPTTLAAEPTQVRTVGAGGRVQLTPTNHSSAFALAVDSGNVYWTSGSASWIGAVMKVPVGGGTAVTLASGWETGSPSPSFGLAVDVTAVYWTNVGVAHSGTVMKVPLGGGPATVLASGQDAPSGIAVDAKNVYWANRTAVMRIAK